MTHVTYTDLTNADQRLYVLKSLVNMGYDANDQMLITALEAFGHRISHSDMIDHLSFLANLNLVVLSKIANLTKVELTQKGQDVADGRTLIIGIRRPKAGE